MPAATARSPWSCSVLLADAGHQPVGIIRNPDQAADLERAGGTALVLDLENTDASALAAQLAGADAVVFAAGGGPDSGGGSQADGGPGRRHPAGRSGPGGRCPALSEVSALATDDYEPDSEDVFQVYLRAKSEADADLRARDLDWTIVRPGRLDQRGADRIRPGRRLDRSRHHTPGGCRGRAGRVGAHRCAVRTQFELISGDTPVAEACAAL